MKFKKHEHEVGVLVYHYILQYVSVVMVMFYSLVLVLPGGWIFVHIFM